MNNNSTLTLGEKIMYVRKARGYSQENLGYAIKRNRPFVQRIENGQVECDVELLAEIRKFLEIEDAPLLEHELKLYRYHLEVWGDLIESKRLDEAKAMQSQLSPILIMPFEADLFLLYTMTETLLLLEESNFAAAKEKLNAVEASIDDASIEVRHMFYRNKGYFYGRQGDFENSLKHSLLAIDNTSNDFKPGYFVLTNIGIAYISMGKVHKGIVFLERAKLEYDGDRTHNRGIIIDSSLAAGYMQIGEEDVARQLYEESLSLAKILNDEFRIAVISQNLATLNQRQMNFNEALTLLDQALKHHTSNSFGYAAALHNKAHCLFKMKAYDKCREIIKQAEPLTEGDEELTIMFESLGHLMTLSEKTSISYLEDVAIPYFRACKNASKYKAIPLCNELEILYRKKKSKLKSLTMAAIAKDIYEEMYYGRGSL